MCVVEFSSLCPLDSYFLLFHGLLSHPAVSWLPMLLMCYLRLNRVFLLGFCLGWVFIVSCLMLRSLVVDTGFLTPFVEEVALYMLGNPGMFMHQYVAVYAEIMSCLSIPFHGLCVFLLVPHCFDYCGQFCISSVWNTRPQRILRISDYHVVWEVFLTIPSSLSFFQP